MAVSGPPYCLASLAAPPRHRLVGFLYERVVDEPDVADARGDGDQDVPVERVDGSEGVRVDDGEVLRLDAGLAHRLLAGGAHRRRAVVPRRRGGVEAALEREGPRAVVAAQADVAARERQAVVLPDR